MWSGLLIGPLFSIGVGAVCLAVLIKGHNVIIAIIATKFRFLEGTCGSEELGEYEDLHFSNCGCWTDTGPCSW